MKDEKVKFCPALWLSGFFALGAVVHLVRLLFRASLVVGGYEVSFGLSTILVLVLGGLSIGAAILSLKRPCEHNKTLNDCCKH